jgi:hypothetical protein
MLLGTLQASYFIITFTVRQVMRGLDFSSRGKNLYDRIISLIEEVWANKASLTPPLFIEVSIPSYDSERNLLVCGIDFAYF